MSFACKTSVCWVRKIPKCWHGQRRTTGSFSLMTGRRFPHLPTRAWRTVSRCQVFVFNDRLPIGKVIDELLLISACTEMHEWDQLVAFLPL